MRTSGYGPGNYRTQLFQQGHYSKVTTIAKFMKISEIYHYFYKLAKYFHLTHVKKYLITFIGM